MADLHPKAVETHNLISFDTETTGLSMRNGCRPFFLILQEPKKSPVAFEWDVNPLSRTPIIPPEDIDDICRRFEGKTAIGFNTKFDLLALESIGIRLWDIVGWRNIHDAMLMSHAYESGGSHGLKALCVRHLGLLDDDEKRLGKACISARHIGKRLKWAIAKEGHPHFRGTRFSSEKNPAWKADMWLPRAVCIAQNRPVDDPWWTILENYACLDGKRTLDLFLHLQKKLEGEDLWDQYEKNRRLIEVTYNTMERRGVSMRGHVVREEQMRFSKAVRVYSQAAKDCINRQDINLNSAEDLQRIFYGEYGLPVLDLTDNKNPSVASDTLAKLHPLCPPLLQRFIENIIIQRKFGKGLTYLKNFVGYMINNRVHCNIKITGTTVTRMSVNDPPMQTVGKVLGGKDYWPDSINEALKAAGVNLRRLFGPAPGREWYAIDLQQAHPRIFAWLSGDAESQQVFTEGKDYYVHLASKALNLPPEKIEKTQRAMFKTLNLAQLYGSGVEKLEKVSGIRGISSLLEETFPTRALYIAKINEAAGSLGYVTTAGGYRLYCPDAHKRVNYVILGTEGEIMKQALIDCHNFLEASADQNYDPYVALQVHDELLIDMPASDHTRSVETAKQCARIMEQAAKDHGAIIPAEITFIESGKSWADGRKLGA